MALQLRFSANEKGESILEFKPWEHSSVPGLNKTSLPSDIRKGLTLMIDGKAVRMESSGTSWFKPQYPQIAVPKTGAKTFELRFYGKSLGRYEYGLDGVKPITLPKLISRFDIRAILNDLYKKDIAGKMGIRRFKQSGVLIESKTNSLASKVDLHTHLTGAPELKDLLNIAEKHKVLYPTDLLDEMRIRWKKTAVIKKNGMDYVPFSKENIEHWSDWDHFSSHIDHKLELPDTYSVDFEQMSDVYRYRSPILKDIATFPDVLETLAEDYARDGVKYSELSFYTIVEPKWTEIANKMIPMLEEKYGVKLRFIVGAWRHSGNATNLEAIRATELAMRNSPYIVGIDFMGHESNSTLEIKESISRAALLKKEFPNAVIRVHAGENPLHPENIEEAIRAGATRVGHGIYGVTPETIRLAKEHNVIVEFNLNSNLALKNIDGTTPLKSAAKKYLDAGVRVTFGTDGHGIYQTSPQSEESVARAIGFKNKDLEAVAQSNQLYMDQMDRDFKTRSSHQPELQPCSSLGFLRSAF